MSFLHSAKNSIKANGFCGALRVYKNHLKIKNFYKQYGDVKDIVSDDVASEVYDSDYQNNADFSEYKSFVKPLAFYLPQFHTIPENDAWWGEGFTEWTNTRKCEPRFNKHYQPREPHDDIGYYNLEDVNVLKSQAELAKSHGIYGFCFYHYWFSGKRLLEKPVDILLDHPEIDINFLLCWANENWTKAWDGQSNNVLIKQNYAKSDPEQFIDDLQKYINDPRYIKIDSKPVILIYNCSEIPNVKATFSKMRKRAKETGIGEILIWACRTHHTTAQTLKITDYIDAEVEFPPHNTALDVLKEDSITTNERSNIYNYNKLVQFVTGRYNEEKSKKPVYRTVMAAWDNSCRRKDNYTVYCGFSLKSFYRWVRAAVENASSLKENERFIFVNAFNEWAEGTYLEPDKKYGYANINTFSRALFGLPLNKPATVLTKTEPENVTAPKIAVQAHITSIDVLSQIIGHIEKIPFNFDLFVSTDTPQKLQFIKNSFAQKCPNISLNTESFENTKDDILPLVLQMKSVYKNYDVLCHINSKKSAFTVDGQNLRSYLYDNLLGNSEKIAAIIKEFNLNTSLGLAFLKALTPKEQSGWADNREATEQLLNYLKISSATPSNTAFADMHMFWANPKSLATLFESDITESAALPFSLRFVATYNKFECSEFCFKD
ncbi:MAG: glycoside hydrolase family 99-like domain-containing protein [Clostridia bacterium]|nr:glycoside hydrolase family 99-like domain-containing protein [Clostridia bacterium]